jgi:hypothetical protein
MPILAISNGNRHQQNQSPAASLAGFAYPVTCLMGLLARCLEFTQELIVEIDTRRGHMFEIAESASGRQKIEYFGVQTSFSLMRHVVDGEARDNTTKISQRRQFDREIVSDNGYVIVAGKPGTRSLEHCR